MGAAGVDCAAQALAGRADEQRDGRRASDPPQATACLAQTGRTRALPAKTDPKGCDEGGVRRELGRWRKRPGREHADEPVGVALGGLGRTRCSVRPIRQDPVVEWAGDPLRDIINKGVDDAIFK